MAGPGSRQGAIKRLDAGCGTCSIPAAGAHGVNGPVALADQTVGHYPQVVDGAISCTIAVCIVSLPHQRLCQVGGVAGSIDKGE